MYNNSEENKRIEKSVIYTAKQENTFEIVRNGIAKGYDNQIIADITGFTFEQIEQIRNTED